jgi:hypothetical protein
MPERSSVLAGVTAAAVVELPFPHLVVHNALDPAYCAQLLEEIPSIETLAQGRTVGSNERVSYPCSATRTDPSISPTWRRFLDEHVDQAFFNRMMSAFGAALRRLHPRFETRYGQIGRLRAGLRGRENFDQADVLLDAQVCANTPVLDRVSSVRGAHVDAPDKLFVGLYYLRRPADVSTGGDLQLYGSRADGQRERWRRAAAESRFELFRTIPYAHNVLVLFLNSIRSVHLVTERSPTPYPRLFVNFVGEVREPLWRCQARAGERLRQRMLWNTMARMSWTGTRRECAAC